MRQSRTLTPKLTTVYIYDNLTDAERAFRAKLNILEVRLRYSWSGYIGSVDGGDIKLYYMTTEKFKSWKNTNVYDHVYHVVKKEVNKNERDESTDGGNGKV